MTSRARWEQRLREWQSELATNRRGLAHFAPQAIQRIKQILGLP